MITFHFSPTFLKLWVHVFDNIAGAEGGNTREGIGIAKEKEVFSPFQ